MNLTEESFSFQVAIVLIVLFVSSTSYAAETPIKLRVAYPTLTGSYAVAWIAKEEQIFKKNGLDVAEHRRQIPVHHLERRALLGGQDEAIPLSQAGEGFEPSQLTELNRW